MGDAQVELRLGEIGHDVRCRTAAANVADVEHHAGHLVRQALRGDEKLRERRDGVSPRAQRMSGVRRSAMTGRDEIPRALARVHEVAVRSRGFKDEAELVALRRGGEEGPGAERSDFLVGPEQHFVADLRGMRGRLKRLQRGEHHDQAALHVDHAGTAELLGREQGAFLKRIGCAVDGVVVPAAEKLDGRGRADAEAEGLGGCVRERDVLDVAGQRGELGVQQREHRGEAGKMVGAGVLLGPAREQVAQFGGAGGQGGDGGRQTHSPHAGKPPDKLEARSGGAMRLNFPRGLSRLVPFNWDCTDAEQSLDRMNRIDRMG